MQRPARDDITRSKSNRERGTLDESGYIFNRSVTSPVSTASGESGRRLLTSTIQHTSKEREGKKNYRGNFYLHTRKRLARFSGKVSLMFLCVRMYDIQSINNEKGLFMTVSLSLKEIPSLSLIHLPFHLLKTKLRNRFCLLCRALTASKNKE